MIQLKFPNWHWKHTLGRFLMAIALMLFLTQLIPTPALATGVYQIPPLKVGEPTWILDQAEVLSRSTRGQISNQLEKLAQETGNEVRFVTIRRFDYGETAETFTEKLFKKWFPTPEAAAHQTLYVLDTLTNNGAIYTGEAVKSVMSSEIAESVANETIQVPLRQENKYNEAFLAATDRLSAVLAGEPDPGPPSETEEIVVARTYKSAEETNTNSATTIVVILLILATLIPMATYYYYQNSSN